MRSLSVWPAGILKNISAVAPFDCFVTGTDTGIGKTHVSAALLKAWRGQGAGVVGMKPVASGSEVTPEGLRNEDALRLIEAAGTHLPYSRINPFALEAPLAPELAAAKDGVEITLAPIQAAYAELRQASDHVLVEGVGGWLSPITAEIDQKDIVHTLGLPVILVVGVRLGCVHQARATAHAIVADGCTLAGWIANEIDPAMDCFDENLQILERVLAQPPMAVIRFGAPTP